MLASRLVVLYLSISIYSIVCISCANPEPNIILISQKIQINRGLHRLFLIVVNHTNFLKELQSTSKPFPKQILNHAFIWSSSNDQM